MIRCLDADLRCPRSIHDHGRCARCGGPACPRCDHCHGCGRIVCEACDVGTPTSARFAWAGDAYPHPHSIVEVP